jgi:hypothetical protein
MRHGSRDSGIALKGLKKHAASFDGAAPLFFSGDWILILRISPEWVGSLDGLDTLDDLRYLEISHAPKLSLLKPLGGAGIRERHLASSIV